MTEPRPLPDLLPSNALADPDEARKMVTRYAASLTERLHLTVAELRKERRDRLGPDMRLGRTDVAPLLRQLASFADLMTYIAKCMREVAATATELAGQEVHETGENRVVTPDGNGREVVVKVGASRSRKIDFPALLAAVAAVRTTEHLRTLAGDEHLSDQQREAFAEVYRMAYRQAQEDVQALTTPSGLQNAASVTKVDALSRALQAHGQDDLAGLLDRTLHWETGDEKTTITVEDPKARRRG